VVLGVVVVRGKGGGGVERSTDISLQGVR